MFEIGRCRTFLDEDPNVNHLHAMEDMARNQKIMGDEKMAQILNLMKGAATGSGFGFESTHPAG